MQQHNVFTPVPKHMIPPGTKVLTSTWAMKKKASGKRRARINARGFEQIDGQHYDSNTKGLPVVSPMTIMIVLTLMVMAGWYGAHPRHQWSVPARRI